MKNGSRLFLLIALCAGLLLSVSAQEFNRPAPVPTKAYIVGGVRHGASFFPRANYAPSSPRRPARWTSSTITPTTRSTPS